nr:MAG TPA: hypothetical protein [Caudoviricetes sp.]
MDEAIPRQQPHWRITHSKRINSIKRGIHRYLHLIVVNERSDGNLIV